MNPCLAFLTHWSYFGIIALWQFEMLINLFYLVINIVHGRISASPPHLSIPGHYHLTAGRAGTHFQVLAWGFDLFLPQLKVHLRACSFPQQSLHEHLWHHTTRQGPGSRFVLTHLFPRLSCAYPHSSWPWFLPGSIWELNPAFSSCCWWGWIESSSTQV